MIKYKYFLRYLGLDGKWHRVQIGKTAKVTYTHDYDQETKQNITIIRKGAQSFKAVVYTFSKEPICTELK